MLLSELAREIGGQVVGPDVEVTGVAADSRQVQAGQLFVAIPGARADGRQFVDDALRNGAAAICAGEALNGVATLVTADPRRATARLAALLQGHPARELVLVGVTGSLGKTSTALLVEATLSAAGLHPGVIGSLGIRFDGAVEYTGMTTPEAPAIHEALRRMVSRGITHCVMEVTSHSLRLHRVDGLAFDVGVLTNLVPDEHLEFHATPDDYLRTKLRFIELLKPGAPLVANVDDDLVRRAVAPLSRPVVGVSLEQRADSVVRVENLRTTSGGSRFTLAAADALPLAGGGSLPAFSIPVVLPVLGRTNVANAAHAAAAALMAGADPDAVRRALAGAQPMHRRMQLLHDAGPVVLDDTVGNPLSMRAVFDVASQLEHGRLRVVYAVRGSRGEEINARNAQALADGVRAAGGELVVTSSEDTADAANRVTPEERDAVLATLRDAGVPFRYEPSLELAVQLTLEESADEDLVLLLGAQGMDAGGAVARRHLGIDRRRRAR